MEHRILLPTDFSDNAWSAALYAIRLYKNEPCTFYFSHAWTFLNLGTRTHIPKSALDPAKADVKKQLTALKAKAEQLSENTNHNFKTLFSEGSIEDTIKSAVKKFKISLVIMGTKGATGAKEILFGSNTVMVINRIKNCPFLLIPNNHQFETPDNIGFPTTFKRTYGDELVPLTHLADLYGSQLKILHIHEKEHLSEQQDSNLEQLKTILKDYQFDLNWMPKSSKKEQAITTFINDKNIKILCMINYEKSFIQRLIKEPIINKMGFHCFIPFLVIPCRS